MKLKNKKKGFTLVELIVVMAIIAILSAVSVSSYFLITNQAKQSAATQTADALRTEIFALTSGDGFEFTVYDKYNVTDSTTTTTTTATTTYTMVANAQNTIDVTWDTVTTAGTSKEDSVTNTELKLNVAEDIIYGLATIWADTDSTKVSGYEDQLAFEGSATGSKANITAISACTNGIWATFSLSKASSVSNLTALAAVS